MTRAVVLCADDYALSPGISRAIVQLAEQGRLSAISCMTGSAHWSEHADWLRPLIGKVDIGLHLTLVDEVPLTAMPHTAPNGKLPSIGALMVRTYLGQVRLPKSSAKSLPSLLRSKLRWAARLIMWTVICIPMCYLASVKLFCAWRRLMRRTRGSAMLLNLGHGSSSVALQCRKAC